MMYGVIIKNYKLISTQSLQHSVLIHKVIVLTF